MLYCQKLLYGQLSLKKSAVQVTPMLIAVKKAWYKSYHVWVLLYTVYCMHSNSLKIIVDLIIFNKRMLARQSVEGIC